MAATRRLAAILAADVAGYSRLMGADEEGTLERLRAIRSDLTDPQIATHRGRIVKTTGDGFLAEFGSTVDALRCAGDIQARMAEQNAGAPPESRIDWRIGIHQGDIVVEEDGDIFGDGVNVAARLEALAQPGGICISGRVQEDAAGKLDLAFRDLGQQQLRNIARPVHAYTVSAEAMWSPRRRMSIAALLTASVVVVAIVAFAVFWAWPRLWPQAPASGEPGSAVAVAEPAPRLSIVVLPFANLSSDPEQEYFADGITDDLTTDLSRIGGSFVIARTTAFTYKGKAAGIKQISRELGVRYVLEGSVRRFGGRVQVNVQLIDGESGTHLWADRFDVERSDLAEAQSEITSRLARTLGLELVRDAGRRVEEQRVVDPTAADLVLQARAIGSRPFSPKNRDDALRAYERALERDPHSIDARIGIALMLANGPQATGPATPQDAERAEQLLREVMERDPNRSDAYRTIAMLRTAQNRWDEVTSALKTAVSLDPNNAAALRNLGQRLHFTGDSGAAIPLIEKALRLSPRDSGVAFGYLNLGDCYLFLGQPDKAMELFRKGVAAAPRIYYIHLVLAGALGLKGELDEARSEIAESQKIKPDIGSVSRWRDELRRIGLGHPLWLAQMDQTVFEGLRRAGFPDE